MKESKIEEKTITDESKKSIIKSKKALKVSLTIVAFVLTFVLGFVTNFFVITSPSKTVQWVTDHIVNYGYFFDEDGNKIEITGDQMAEAIAEKILDQYSAYYTQEEYSDVVKSSKGENLGIGISFLNSDTSCKVFKVVLNSPAQKAGIVAGDIIVGAKKEQGERQDFSDRNSLTTFLKTVDKDENITLFVSTDGNEREVLVTKKEFIEAYCEYYDNQMMGQFTSESGTPIFELSLSNAMSYLDNDTAYISLSQFEGNASDEIKDCLNTFKQRGKTKLILDLRNNGGGSLTVLQNIASYLIDSEEEYPVIAYAENSKGKMKSYCASGKNSKFGIEKISVIANKNSASASECLIGALRFYSGVSEDRLIIEDNTGLDNKTYGKGIMQTTYLNLSTGSAIKLTTAKLYLPDGVTSIHKVGFIGKAENCVSYENCISRAQEVLR